MKNKGKISIQELFQDIAARSECDKKEVEAFMKSFVAVIDEGLVKEGVSKIKGLGTLKLQWNEPRKSVNVRTGEEYTILGHNKIVFVPEQTVKDLINEPYAGMKTMDVNEDAVNDEKEQIEKLHSQALEIKNLLADFNELNNINPEKRVDENCPSRNQNTEISNVGDDEVESNDGNARNGENSVIMPTSTSTDYVAPSPIENYDTGERKLPVRKGKKSKLIDWLLILFVVLCLVGVVFYIEIETNCFSTFFNEKYAKIECYIDKLNADKARAEADERNAAKIKAQKAALEAREKEKQATAEKYGVSDTMKYKPVEIPKAKKVVLASNEQDKSTLKTEEIARTPVKSELKSNELLATITLSKGDRLTLVAERYYGHKDYWVYVFEENKNVIKNPDAVRAGMILKIPKLDKEKVDVNNPQTLIKAKELAKKYLKK